MGRYKEADLIPIATHNDLKRLIATLSLPPYTKKGVVDNSHNPFFT